VVNSTPRPPLPPGKPVPIVQEAGWASELVWIGAEISPPPGFDPQTFQPVASCYTHYSIPSSYTGLLTFKNLLLLFIYRSHTRIDVNGVVLMHSVQMEDERAIRNKN
jgi:hypothetical protein